MIQVPLETTSDEDIELFFKGIQLVFNQFDQKIGEDEAAHCLISLSFNMLRHSLEHAFPDSDSEQLNDKLREHLNRMLTAMEDEVWNQQ